MTPEDHNKTLAVCHLVYGGFYAFLLVGMAFIFLAVGAAGRRGPDGAEAFAFIAIFFGLFAFFSLFCAAPSFVAGYALFEKKSWAKVATTMAGIMDALNFPFGTALCVYSLWFAFGEPGRALYDNPGGRWDYRAKELQAGLDEIPWYRDPRNRAREISSTPTRPNWRE